MLLSTTSTSPSWIRGAMESPRARTKKVEYAETLASASRDRCGSSGCRQFRCSRRRFQTTSPHTSISSSLPSMYGLRVLSSGISASRPSTEPRRVILKSSWMAETTTSPRNAWALLSTTNTSPSRISGNIESPSAGSRCIEVAVTLTSSSRESGVSS